MNMADTASNGGRDARESSWHLPDVLQFMRVLWAVVHGLQRTSKRMTSDVGVTGPQRLVLRVVGLFPGLSAGQLAAVLHVHPSTLTGVIQRLAAQRLLVRTDDVRDRRRAVLRLTTRGTRANAARHGTVESAIAEALQGISSRDREAARRVLERVAAYLDTPAEIRSRQAGGRARARSMARDDRTNDDRATY
jgi:DNA-binding MarR family transcriptional regulator